MTAPRFIERVVVCVAIAGCSGGDGGAGVDAAAGDGAAGVTDAGSDLLSTRFKRTAYDFGVAASGLADGFHGISQASPSRHWALLDIDGDALSDIVQTGDPAQLTRVWDADGSPFWKVFRNTGSGWAVQALEWPVPPNGSPSGFFSLAVLNFAHNWTTMDMDGDGRADIVQTADPATARVWAETTSPHWKVFRNTGVGFELTPIEWAVPPTSIEGGFSSAHDPAGGWATLDLDGDSKADLIQTRDPDTGDVWDAAGSPHWRVYPGSGGGFATSPVLWQVPSSGVEGGFDAIDSSAPGSGVTAFWTTLDIDGDQRPDLVQTSDPTTGAVFDALGSPQWKVFLGTGTGFELSASAWGVPQAGIDSGFFVARSAGFELHWDVFDIDGDRRPDLVQPGDPSQVDRVWDATGDPYWRVFSNSGAGFLAGVHRWPVPTSPEPAGFYTMRGFFGARQWATVDVTGDRRPDLVHTADPATSVVWDAAGTPHWKVYVNAP